MKTASSLFNDSERATIKAAIAAAEQRSSGQIVPVVATASGRYDRAEDLFGIIFALLVLSGAWWLWPGENSWSAGLDSGPGLLAVVAITFVAFVSGAWLASRLTPLRTPFIAPAEMHGEVDRAARAAFQSNALRNTAGATGVLIYVSLYEHMVRVIADDAVADKIEPQQWQTITDAVVDGMRRGAACAGLVAALQQTGELLATVLPPNEGTANELDDDLIVVD